MSKVSFTFAGSLRDLTKVMKELFKDPNALVLSVEGCYESKDSDLMGVLSMRAFTFLNGGINRNALHQRMEAVVKHVKAREKIQAIKLVREAGCGLQEAKDVVEHVVEPAVFGNVVCRQPTLVEE